MKVFNRQNFIKVSIKAVYPTVADLENIFTP